MYMNIHIYNIYIYIFIYIIYIYISLEKRIGGCPFLRCQISIHSSPSFFTPQIWEEDASHLFLGFFAPFQPGLMGRDGCEFLDGNHDADEDLQNFKSSPQNHNA